MVDFKVAWIELTVFLCMESWVDFYQDPQWLDTFAVRDLKGGVVLPVIWFAAEVFQAFLQVVKCDHFDPQRSLRKGTMNGAGGYLI